jgi:hypothetical protein
MLSDSFAQGNALKPWSVAPYSFRRVDIEICEELRGMVALRTLSAAVADYRWCGKSPLKSGSEKTIRLQRLFGPGWLERPGRRRIKDGLWSRSGYCYPFGRQVQRERDKRRCGNEDADHEQRRRPEFRLAK